MVTVIKKIHPVETDDETPGEKPIQDDWLVWEDEQPEESGDE
jgi:hypothetical protein